MMREILFRGKRKCNGEWVEGSFHSRFGMAFIIGISKALRIDGTEVIPETVGQYTGLSDKNGKKIFEGDIGENIDGLFLVHWSNEKRAFVMSFYSYPQKELYLEEMWEDSEIIGNIHDNPELLKGGVQE